MSRIHCNDQDEQPVFSENPVSLIFYTSIAVVFFSIMHCTLCNFTKDTQ